MDLTAVIEKRGFLIDIDGVLLRGKTPIDGAREFMSFLNESNSQFRLVSNNTTLSRSDYSTKLLDVGFSVSRENLALATTSAATYLSQQGSEVTAYCMGAQGLKDELAEHGVTLTNESMCDYVVVASPFNSQGDIQSQLKRSFTISLRAIHEHDASWIALNRDRIHPTSSGLVPAAGPAVSAVEYMIQQEPEYVAGKPSEDMGQLCLSEMGLEADQCVMIGDSESDIQLAKNAGIPSVFVRSGGVNYEDLRKQDLDPDLVMESIAELTDLLD